MPDINNYSSQTDDTWPFIASIIYTTAWCASFYGQIYVNYKLKSVQGFSLNYLALNVCGYAFYSFYTTVGYFTDTKGAGTVVIADLIFVYHSVLMIIIEIVQCCIYKRGKNKIFNITYATIALLWLIVLVQSILFMTGAVQYYQYWNPIMAMGYGKLFITFIKYTHPVYYNYKRKSTKGWSIFNIVLDLVGGVFSFTSGGLSVTNGLNLTKVILAFITVFYDLIFCFQHYVLYRKPPKNDQQNQQVKLLSSSQQLE